MSRREQILLVVGLAVVILLGFYYLVYVPKSAEFRELTTERDARQARLTQMQQVAAQAPQLERRYQALQAFIRTIEAKLPTEKEIPALLVQLERQTVSLGVDLRSLRPGPLEPVAAGGQAAQPAGAQPPAGGQPAGQAPPAGAQAEYFRFPIAMSFEATYNELISLMGALRSFPRLIAVTRIGLSPRQVPELSFSADTETYVLPKEGR